MEIDSSDNQPFSGYRPYFSLRQHFLKRVQKNKMNMHLGKKTKLRSQMHSMPGKTALGLSQGRFWVKGDV